MITAGIDLSSRALHAALIPADEANPAGLPPVVFRSVELPRFKPGATTAQWRSVERCRVVRDAVRELLRYVLSLEPHVVPYEVSSVWVEEPLGARNKATNVLREIYGSALASIPPHIERASIAPQEWRRVIRDEGWLTPDTWTKADSVGLAVQWVAEHARDYHLAFDALDEHHAEALLVALAGRRLAEQAAEQKGAA